MHHIAVIGAGFAALTAAQRIRALAQPERLFTLPPSWFGHQAKRFYEWWYLRRYR